MAVGGSLMHMKCLLITLCIFFELVAEFSAVTIICAGLKVKHLP
jgi:hypothetical protein